MNKDNENIEEMQPEYDFSDGVRGKYAARIAEENGYVRIDPRVLKHFKTSDSINKILLSIVESLPKTSKFV